MIFRPYRAALVHTVSVVRPEYLEEKLLFVLDCRTTKLLQTDNGKTNTRLYNQYIHA